MEFLSAGGFHMIMFPAFFQYKKNVILSEASI
jgi:hypothetical protein